jgi:perosamine synthetase
MRYQRYRGAFERLCSMALMSSPKKSESNFLQQSLLLDTTIAGKRDEVLQVTNDHGYVTRPEWKLMHNLPIFKNTARVPVDTAELIQPRIINLPGNVRVA